MCPLSPWFSLSWTSTCHTTDKSSNYSCHGTPSPTWCSTYPSIVSNRYPNPSPSGSWPARKSATSDPVPSDHSICSFQTDPQFRTLSCHSSKATTLLSPPLSYTLPALMVCPLSNTMSHVPISRSLVSQCSYPLSPNWIATLSSQWTHPTPDLTNRRSSISSRPSASSNQSTARNSNQAHRTSWPCGDRWRWLYTWTYPPQTPCPTWTRHWIIHPSPPRIAWCNWISSTTRMSLDSVPHLCLYIQSMTSILKHFSSTI